MKVMYQGNARVQRAQLQSLWRSFEILEMKIGESITDYFGRVMIVANYMRNYGKDMSDVKIVEKVLRDDEQVLKVEYENLGAHGRGRGATRGNRSIRGRGRGRILNKATIECFKCHKLGHFQYECPRWEKSANYVEIDDKKAFLLMAHVKLNGAIREGVWFLGHFQYECPRWEKSANYVEIDDKKAFLLMAHIELNGATREGNKEWFMDFDESFRHIVKLGNSSRMPMMWRGNVRLEVKGMTQIITDVFFIPDLTNNLLSIGQLQEKGLTILIGEGVYKVYHPRRGLIVHM
ncbi:uncharacterized protein LOC109838709 [Asparagus officinalis]|uniref:uncharacterized protein LOC109838709 n=1 Tax=Asparagus officinalis TaxID=4686 RepID=UPI00098E6382|nr:uncharacterized protein LOC109838709 [Asparagus officinalis]